MTHSTDQDDPDPVRALLPGLRYLAVEALRTGCHDASKIIFDAIATIERTCSFDHPMDVPGGKP